MSALNLLKEVPSVLLGSLRTLPRVDVRELSRGLVIFGHDAILLAVLIGVLTGAIVIVQTGIYIQQFGARAFLGWAAGYALLHEFGPLLLGLVLASRLGARNAAELATLSIGGQLEGLRGVALDPLRILVTPRVVSITLASGMLAAVMFVAGVSAQVLAALWIVELPIRAFLASFSHPLSGLDLFAGLAKSVCFGAAIAVVSTASGLSAKGGARAVGESAAQAVVASCAAIFALDFVLTLFFIRVLP